MQTKLYSDMLPAGFTARAGKLSDYQLCFELVNAHSRRLNGRNDLNDPELIRLDWLNDGFNPETDIRAVFAPDGALVGLVECWMIDKPPVHPWNRVYVHPDHMENHVWEHLLTWAENRSRAALELVEPGLRVSAHTGTEHHNPASIRIIKNLGWTPLRSFYRMEIDLDSAPEVPALPAGLTIRPYDPVSETEAVYHCLIDSFRDHFDFVEPPFEHGFKEFRHNLIDMPGYDPRFWFVAVDGNEIAGICLCRPVDEEDAESGWVSELGMRRAWRKQGLGFALLQHAFAAFRARGQKRAGLGVDAESLTGALRLYERAGMHIARQFDKFEKELRPGKEISTQSL
ncbi:MAG: GNAT family N-acetyltransferase [Chloroflexi bacterium]|nr:GNAT family N-acetyltransferase [Chloroflexota bacterium]